MKPTVIVAPDFRRMREVFRESALERLARIADVVWGQDGQMPQEGFEEAIRDASAVVFGTWFYGNAIERAGSGLRALLEVAGAHNHHEIGYERALARGIEVGSAAPAFRPAVAELGLGLTLAAIRGIVVADRDFRTGHERWLHEGNVGFNTLFRTTVGFVGCGGLSRSLEGLLQPFQVRKMGFDPYISDAKLRERGVEPASLEAIFDRSNVVYVLAAPTSSSRNIISARLMERLGPWQTLIVLSRASLVDFDALTELTLDGRFRAGIDVFPKEPLEVDHPIRGARNVVLSAHRAGAMPDTLLSIGDMVVADLESIIDGGEARQLQYLTTERIPALVPPPSASQPG